MINVRSVGLFLILFLISVTSYAQHGYANSGLGFAYMALFFSALFSFALFVIHLLVYYRKLGHKSIIMGISISILFAAVSFLVAINTPNMLDYALGVILLSLLSIFHLVYAFKKIKAHKVTKDEILDD